MCAYISVSIWFSERRDVGVEETLVSSGIDLNLSIGLHDIVHVHVARAVSLQDLLEK